MNEFIKWHHDIIGEKLVKALTKNNFTATYLQTRQEALDKLLEWIPTSAIIGFGGSVTLDQLGIVAKLEQRGNSVLNYTKPGLSLQEIRTIRRQHFLADVYLSGTNAVTLDGKLVNVDSTGNRVGPILFGPDKVFIVVGINKIVNDVEEAEKRVRLWASPSNNKRLGYSNPCTQTGVCMDCQEPTRICNITTIMHKRPKMTDVHVIIVAEKLGL